MEAGATFSGGGGILNPEGSALQLLDGADVGVLVQNEGTLGIGASAGQSTGLDFTQTATGWSEFELGGAGLMDYDRMSLTGLADLDGTLFVSLINGFAPTLGDTFTLLSATGGVTGAFADVELPSLTGGLGWSVNYDPTLVQLLVTQLTGDPDFNTDGSLDCLDADALVAEIVAGTHGTLYDLTGDGSVDSADLDQWLADAGAVNLASGNPYLIGDANLDGVVDGQDFVEWNDHKFTSSAAWCDGDFNADGVVDGQDFVLWNNNKFMAADASVGPSDNISAVPEPAHAVWLISFAWMLLCRTDVGRNKRPKC